MMSGPMASTPRTVSGGFKTSDGTLYVSKPYRSKSSKKLRALITFMPRKSHFDISNESSGTNEFRGFFSLFWISIFIFALQVYVRGIEASGRPLNLAFATMFSQDAIVLALSDATLVLSTGICVPFAIAIKRRWIRYYWTGLIIQHLLQTLILFTAITWTFNRKWPWVQSGFLTLHSLVMIMKMHSYMTINGHLQQVTFHSETLLEQLRMATRSFGGWDQAILDAKSHRAEMDALTGMDSSTSTTPSRTPDIPEGSTTTYTDAATAIALRKRLTTVSQAVDGNIAVIDTPLQGADSKHEDSHKPREPHPLVDHPDDQIAEMAKDYSELQSELTSPGPNYVTWPNNITLKNFAIYQLIPTLVYELEYPRTDHIRPIYVFEKTVATFGTFALLYTVTESFILPYIPTTEQSTLRSLLDLALPFMIAYLLLFFIIFGQGYSTSPMSSPMRLKIKNVFAMHLQNLLTSRTVNFMKTGLALFLFQGISTFLTGKIIVGVASDILSPGLFIHRRWNSTSWDEFSRKWNKPVHVFLLRHVYAPTILGYGLSKTWAMFFTFLLSACVHELVMVIVTQKFRMYLFVLQIVQIPLIVISRTSVVKRNKRLGNIVFWLGLYAGFPLLCVAYVAY